MSLDAPQQNKMMTAPPAKKGFHFASDGIHLAEFIEAATIQEAEVIYHKIKRLISDAPAAVATSATDAAPASAPEQSTVATEQKADETAIQ
jgi:hypothetical protein